MGTNQTMNLRYAVVKTEGATPGTFVAPATAQHIIRIREPVWSPDIPLDNEAEKWGDGTHAEDLSLAGYQAGKINFSVRCNAGATDVTAPQWQTLALGCGCVNTAAYATTKGIGLVRRKQYDDATYSIVIYDVEIGGAAPVTTEYQFVGCTGNMKIGCAGVGAPWVAQFEFQGALKDIVDGTAIALTTPGTVVPQTFLSHVCSIDGNAKNIGSWMLDLGNVVTPVMDQTKAYGISHYVITKSSPRFNCNVLATKQATTGADYLANLLVKPTSNVLIMGTPTTAKLSISAPDMQLMSIPQSPRDGFVAWDLTYKLLANGVPGTPLDESLGYEDTFEILQGTRT